MKAAFLEDVEKIVVRQTADPTVSPHEVIVKVRAVGVCGTDLHLFRGQGNYNLDSNGFPLRIQIVISLAAKEMKISPANAYSSHLDNHFVGGNRWIRCLTDYNFFNIFEKSSFHQEPFYQLSKAIYRSLRLL